MSSHPQNIIIVGASLAGAKAAETLRDEGYEGRLVLIGEEPERPYEGPPTDQGLPPQRVAARHSPRPPRRLLSRA
jgi:NADPH-dependent 2,4-dienoyl-CoA reductase/sulfur reductase-like enzyme